MDQIPLLGWVAIILIAAVFVLINLGLVSIVRNRSQFDELAKRLQARPPSRTAQTIERVKEVLRDPFREERTQINELSKLVDTLREPPQPEAAPHSPEQKDNSV